MTLLRTRGESIALALKAMSSTAQRALVKALHGVVVQGGSTWGEGRHLVGGTIHGEVVYSTVGAEGVPGRLTLRSFGAVADGVTDDTEAFNAAANALRASFDEGHTAYTAWIDGEGLLYRCDTPVNFTNIRGRMAAIVNFSVVSAAAGEIVLDFTGSQNLYLDRIYVYGDPDGPPAVGYFFGRISDGLVPHPTAASNNIGFVEYAGNFTMAGFMNLASEVMHIDTLKGANAYWRNTAACSIFSGNSDIINDFCGLPTSLYQEIGLGSQSLGSVIIDNHNPQRGSAYIYPITSISKANPAVVTISAANAAAGAANFGLANGAQVFLDSTLGSVGVGADNHWRAELGWRVFTVANFDAAAGTFELSGVDTTGFDGVFVSANLRNDTGPATVLGQLGLYRENGGYQVAYSDHHYRFDARGGTVTAPADVNWRMTLSGRYEPASDHLIRIIGDDEERIIRGLSITSDNSAFRESLFNVVGVSGGLTFYDINVLLGHQAQGPTIGMFDDASRVSLYGGFFAVPNNNFLTPVEDFVISTARWQSSASADGGVRQDGPIQMVARAPGAASVQFRLDDDTAAVGPYVDMRRISANPTTSDLLASLRWLGRNSDDEETAYAAIRTEIRDSAAGSTSGAMSILLRANGSDVEAFRLEGGTFRLQKRYTVAELAGITPGAGMIAYATDGRKNGEGAAAGTGVLVFGDGLGWRACDTGATVAA